MADLAPYLWLMAPQYVSVEGEITIEGDYIRIVATFDWTSFLPSMNANIDHIWIALPRDTYNAADTAIMGYDQNGDPLPLQAIPPYGVYIWDYLTEWTEAEGYDPTIGYIGRLTINSDDHVMALIRGDCYDFITIRDFFPSGVHASGDMDIKWKRQAGAVLGIPVDAGTPYAAPISRTQGVVRTSKRDPRGKRR